MIKHLELNDDDDDDRICCEKRFEDFMMIFFFGGVFGSLILQSVFLFVFLKFSIFAWGGAKSLFHVQKKISLFIQLHLL
jgi:hypothetical protein